MIRKASEEFRNLPQRLAEEAHLEELQKMAEIPELKEGLTLNPPDKPLKAWVEELPPQTSPPPTPGESAPTEEPPAPKDNPPA